MATSNPKLLAFRATPADLARVQAEQERLEAEIGGPVSMSTAMRSLIARASTLTEGKELTEAA